jgi:hypothetical protein
MYNKIMNLKIKILKDRENNLMVSFSYNPQFVEEINPIYPLCENERVRGIL